MSKNYNGPERREDCAMFCVETAKIKSKMTILLTVISVFFSALLVIMGAIWNNQTSLSITVTNALQTISANSARIGNLEKRTDSQEVRVNEHLEGGR